MLTATLAMADAVRANKVAVLAERALGTVKWLNVKHGYGFINRYDAGDDILVHHSAIKRNNPEASGGASAMEWWSSLT